MARTSNAFRVEPQKAFFSYLTLPLILVLNVASGGIFLQMWRMTDLIHRPEDEVLAELDKYRTEIVPAASVA